MGLFKMFRKDKKNERYKMSLHKTRESFGSLKSLLEKAKRIDLSLYDELEELFIKADIGVDTVIHFIELIKQEVAIKNIDDPLLLQEIIVDKMFEIYLKGEVVNANLKSSDALNVYLFVGVNGVGKTTSIGKIAKSLKQNGEKVMVVAGDTFRAGAIAQLEEWAKRADVSFFAKHAGSDPSNVIFEAIEKAKKEGITTILCDTAGRLQNKVNLMNELAKIKRVISREIPSAPQETLLVIDATTGQNGMNQAKVFLECTEVSGVILTKLDGTAKGGIVLAIRHELNIPIKYVCLGEKIDDIAVFDIEEYLYGLFSEFFE